MNSPEDALLSVEAVHHRLQAAGLDVEAASASLATLEVDLRNIPGPGVVTIPSTIAVQREIVLLKACLMRVVGEIEQRCPPRVAGSGEQVEVQIALGQLV